MSLQFTNPLINIEFLNYTLTPEDILNTYHRQPATKQAYELLNFLKSQIVDKIYCERELTKESLELLDAISKVEVELVNGLIESNRSYGYIYK